MSRYHFNVKRSKIMITRLAYYIASKWTRTAYQTAMRTSYLAGTRPHSQITSKPIWNIVYAVLYITASYRFKYKTLRRNLWDLLLLEGRSKMSKLLQYAISRKRCETGLRSQLITTVTHRCTVPKRQQLVSCNAVRVVSGASNRSDAIRLLQGLTALASGCISYRLSEHNMSLCALK